MNLQMKIMLSVAEMVELYTDPSHNDPWVIGWSGGKDSTTVLELVTRTLQVVPKDKRTRQIFAIMSDTLMENPELDHYMVGQVELVNKWAAENEMPLEAVQVHRKDDSSFFYLLIGKGYPLPNQKNRWCTHKLKIEPQNKIIAEINPALVLLGVRSEESARRAASIERYRESKESRFGYHFNFPEIRTYMPIVDYLIDEVWAVLQQPLRWGSSEDIRRLYREATGECALTNPEGATELANACGARFGCWTCPPIKKDKSTENMAEIHEWMSPLVAWRKVLLEVYKNADSKSGYMRNGKFLGEGKGSLTLKAKEYLLTTLLATEEKVNDLREGVGLPPLKLLSSLEVEMIRRQWVIDSEKAPWLNGGVVV